MASVREFGSITYKNVPNFVTRLHTTFLKINRSNSRFGDLPCTKWNGIILELIIVDMLALRYSLPGQSGAH